jgi:hypothetical protein
MKVPFKVNCIHISKVRLGEPMLCKYVIKNITEEVLYVHVSIGVEQD